MANPPGSTQEKLGRLLESLPLADESSCSYFDGRVSRFREFHFLGDLPEGAFQVAMDSGYRRCGDVYYQTHCPGCRLCIPLRIVARDFVPSRNMRRVLRRNEDVSVTIGDPSPTSEKAALYVRYKYEQHHLRPALTADAETDFDPDYHHHVMLFQMYTNPSSTREMVIRLGDTVIGFGTIDVVADAGSAVYFAFDPEHRERSLGTYAILKGIEWAQSTGRPYYHLGFMIPGHLKMDYKRRFQPLEFLNRDSQRWEPFDDTAMADYLEKTP